MCEFTFMILHNSKICFFDTIKTKEKSYHNQHLTNQFFSLTIEIFRYLYKQVHVFLHNCANVIWSLKKLKSPPFFIFVTFFHQNFQLHCQGCKQNSILSQVLTIGLATSPLPLLRTQPHHHDRPITSRWLVRWRVFDILTSFKCSLF
jgi:hypothetical protein